MEGLRSINNNGRRIRILWVLYRVLVCAMMVMVMDMAVPNVLAVTSTTFLLASITGQGSLWPSLVPTSPTIIDAWWPTLGSLDNVKQSLLSNAIGMKFSGNDAATSSLPTEYRYGNDQLSPSLSSVDDIITLQFTTPSLSRGVWLVWLSIDNGTTWDTSSASLTVYTASVLSYTLTSPQTVRCTGGNTISYIVSGLTQAAVQTAVTDGAGTAILTGKNYEGVVTTVEFPVTLSMTTLGALVSGLLPDVLTEFIPSTETASGLASLNVTVLISLNGVTHHNTSTSLTLSPSRPLRVLYAFGGPVAEESWSYYHNLARLALASRWQGSLETIILVRVFILFGHLINSHLIFHLPSTAVAGTYLDMGCFLQVSSNFGAAIVVDICASFRSTHCIVRHCYLS
jgi:hypothetical protein